MQSSNNDCINQAPPETAKTRTEVNNTGASFLVGDTNKPIPFNWPFGAHVRIPHEIPLTESSPSPSTHPLTHIYPRCVQQQLCDLETNPSEKGGVGLVCLVPTVQKLVHFLREHATTIITRRV